MLSRGTEMRVRIPDEVKRKTAQMRFLVPSCDERVRYEEISTKRLDEIPFALGCVPSDGKTEQHAAVALSFRHELR